MEDKEFINKEFPQNCGDSLFVIEKTNLKNKNGNYLFRCCFQKYIYEIFAGKREILKGTIVNPQIEQIEFIDKLWPQNCGDTLRIIKKSDKKDNKNHHYLYKCSFLKYPYEILALKSNIIKGTIANPIIIQQEEENFCKAIWPQNCGDFLEIIEKVGLIDKNIYYKARFLKYPKEVVVSKDSIKKGSVFNSRIDEIRFVGFCFLQKRGDIIKVLEKTDKKDKSKNPLYKCLLNDKIILLAPKYKILAGELNSYKYKK